MQFTFTIPDAQVPRIRAWMLSKFVLEDELGNPLPVPSDAEILDEFKRLIHRYIKGEVQQFELLQEHEAVFAAYTQIDVTD